LGFFVTVAGVFIAASRLQNLRLSNDRKQELMDVVARDLADWRPENGIHGFEDCKAAFERNFDSLTRIQHEPRFIASDALGMWVVWNLLGRAPVAEEERKLARAVGTAVVHNFLHGGTIIPTVVAEFTPHYGGGGTEDLLRNACCGSSTAVASSWVRRMIGQNAAAK
jgi:hypothetical protein